MLSVLEFCVQINHPRGKGKRTRNKVQFEMLLVGKPIEESTWVEGIYVFSRNASITPVMQII